MSKTRHAKPGSPLSQERYMSSPEYAELRGISGPAVTTKAALMLNPDKKRLLFFLQGMSIKPGGLKKITREIVETFPDRIGTPTMHKAGMQPGMAYDSKTRREIASEICQEFVRSEEAKEFETFDYCLATCRRLLLSSMEGFLIELCINPKLYFSAPGEPDYAEDIQNIMIEDQFIEGPVDPDSRKETPTYKTANLPWFSDIIGALFEHKRRYEEQRRKEFVSTEVGKKVFETLDFGLATGKMVLVEGNSRIGKTTASEAWADMHQGEARLVSLSGITHKTGLFRALAKELGIGSSSSRSSTEIQTRIEDQLHRSRLMIIFDEAHHLFSSSERVYSRPELVDWINTALFNHRVPVGLICTKNRPLGTLTS